MATTTMKKKVSANGTGRSRREIAEEKLGELADIRIDLEERAERARHRMYAGMLRAHKAGMTYDDIAGVTGLSKIRVSQVLAEQRDK